MLSSSSQWLCCWHQADALVMFFSRCESGCAAIPEPVLLLLLLLEGTTPPSGTVAQVERQTATAVALTVAMAVRAAASKP
jgi:hypothetical protein